MSEDNVLAENQAENLAPEPESQVEGRVNAEASESATDKQEKDVNNGIQERINKITADKYAERQKAEWWQSEHMTSWCFLLV